MNDSLSVFIIAGEPSGDALGASLMSGLKRLTNVSFTGVGGNMMEEEGLNSLFPMDELSIMGLVEVLPKLRGILRRISQTAEAVINSDVDVLITIDSPDFCLRVAAKVKKVKPDLKVIHYVAPSVWAWRPERAEKMAKYVDHVLALLPFEPPYMTAAGMSCDFVGHPVVSKRQATDTEVLEFRNALSLTSNQKLLTVLPGSRTAEVKRLSPIFYEVIQSLKETVPDLAIVIPAVGKRVNQLEAAFAGLDVTILDPRGVTVEQAETRKRVCFAASSAALAASGTVSLELSAAGTPMVIAYKLQWLTMYLMRRKMTVNTVTLANLISETMTIPEFLQEECTVENILPAISELLNAGEQADLQRRINAEVMQTLGRGESSSELRAANSVLSFLHKK